MYNFSLVINNNENIDLVVKSHMVNQIGKSIQAYIQAFSGSSIEIVSISLPGFDELPPRIAESIGSYSRDAEDNFMDRAQ